MWMSQRSGRLTLIALAALMFPSLINAQSGLTDQQRSAYAATFAASKAIDDTGSQASLLSTETPQAEGSVSEQKSDYSRVFRAMSDLQERRTAVPLRTAMMRDYVQSTRNEMAEHALPAGGNHSAGIVYLLMWNHLALDATSVDHTTLSQSFGEQFGPTRTSRALAIVHLAMFEAVNSISRQHTSYGSIQSTVFSKLGVPAAQVHPGTASIERAIVEAAYRTLAAMYPGKEANMFKIAYDSDRERMGDIANSAGDRPSKMVLGEAIGLEAAKAVLEARKFDGSELPDLSSDDFESPNPKTWKQDPISKLAPALGGNWARVKPFVITSADAFRPGTANLPVLPPAFDSPEFASAFKEVKELGGDPNADFSGDRWPTPTSRTGSEDPDKPNPADNTNQTFVGIFWGYDGTALLCAPPRLYNMIATSVALNERPITKVEDMAQYLAFVNIAMADACIAAWDAKYHFLFPRPITYIRTVDVDNTPEGMRNPRWTPLGAPVTNGTNEGRNLTPPFPAYPSGHAAFGGALFRAMTLYFKKLDPIFPDDGIAFKFVSDEYNGMNRSPGSDGARTRIDSHFGSFKEAETLNARSRIYLGIHWQFDADHGILQGNKIADEVYTKLIEPAE